MSDDKDSEIAALKARLEALERQPGPPPGSSAPPPPNLTSKKSGCGTAIIATCVIGALIIMVAQCTSGSGSSSSTNSAYEPVVASWSPPEGYSLERTRSGGIGYKWSKASRSECRSGVSCWAMEVVTEKGCPRSLYVSVTLMSASDQNIGWTNDTAQGVDAGESVRLVFTTYEEGARSAKVAEVSCY